jgi:hypothetical protein
MAAPANAAHILQVILQCLVYGYLPLPPVFLYEVGKLLRAGDLPRNRVPYSAVQSRIEAAHRERGLRAQEGASDGLARRWTKRPGNADLLRMQREYGTKRSCTVQGRHVLREVPLTSSSGT